MEISKLRNLYHCISLEQNKLIRNVVILPGQMLNINWRAGFVNILIVATQKMCDKWHEAGLLFGDVIFFWFKPDYFGNRYQCLSIVAFSGQKTQPNHLPWRKSGRLIQWKPLQPSITAHIYFSFPVRVWDFSVCVFGLEAKRYQLNSHSCNLSSYIYFKILSVSVLWS